MLSAKGGQTASLYWMAPDSYLAGDWMLSAKSGQTASLYWMAPDSYLAGD